MELSIKTSKTCPLHQVKLPKPLMSKHNLDYGDWIIFDVNGDNHAVMVTQFTLEDLIAHGHKHAVISCDSPIAAKIKTDIDIQHHELTIGADPEFFILNKYTGQLVEAYKVLPFESKVGCDGDLAELRPNFALDPNQLVNNISLLISEAHHKLGADLLPYSSSFYQRRCCGFHVHLGMPREVLAFAADKTDLFLKNLVLALDYFVGVPAAAKDPDERRRMSNRYGRPSDYKLNMRTLEYRTPGGYHLCSPAYANNLLSSAFIITEKIINDIEELSEGWVHMHRVTDFSYFKELYDIPSKEDINKLLYSKRREDLLEETEIIDARLKEYSEDYSSNILDQPYEKHDPFLKEWSTYEKERKTQLCTTRG